MLHGRLIHDLHGLVSNSARAPGWGLKITAFRVLMAMMHLKIMVAVGFVMGVSEKITPMGSATSDDPAFRKLSNHPHSTFVFDVVVDELRGHHVLDGFVFQHAEFGFLNGEAGEILSLLHPGETIGLTMRSTSSCVYCVNTAAAVRPLLTSPSR